MKINKLAQVLVFSLLLGATAASARDSSTMVMGTHVTAATHSYILGTGTSDIVRGDNQWLGAVPGQCQAGSKPQVVTSVRDAGETQNCPLSSFKAVNPYANNNAQKGYDVFIGYINVAIYTSACHDRGASLNWTVYCVKDA